MKKIKQFINDFMTSIAKFINDNLFSLIAILASCCAFLLGFFVGSTETPEAEKITPTMRATEIIEQIKNESETPYLKSLGVFEISAYCPCAKCCGKTDGITATGVKATAGRTIAVDPKVIPYGTELFIDGFTYVAEDKGGSVKGNKLDIFFNSHLEALEWGVQEHEVFIYG